MYKAFHSESQDLSDENVLATLAVDGGIFSSRDEALAWLQTSEGEDEVRHATMMAEMNGVQSVPFTIVQVCDYMIHFRHADTAFQDGSDHSSEVLNHVCVSIEQVSKRALLISVAGLIDENAGNADSIT